MTPSFTLRRYAEADEAAVIALWQRCNLTRPWNDPRKDIRRKQAVQPELFILAECQGRIVGSVMAGYDGHRGWINYLAVDPAQQRRGIATQLMAEAERGLRALGCPKINLQVRAGNAEAVAYYRALGFVEDQVVSLGKRLQQD